MSSNGRSIASPRVIRSEYFWRSKPDIFFNWKPKVNIKSLVKDMIDSELKKIQNDKTKF